MKGNIGRIFTAAAGGALLISASPLLAVNISVGSATGGPGDSVTVDIVLQTEGSDVAGTENEIAFDAAAPITGCERNEAIGKEGTAFAFRPAGCTAGTDCTSVKALVLSLSNVDPIPDGSVLYSCTVQLPSDAGCWALTCSAPGSSDPTGTALDTTCSDGEVCVELPPTPTATPVPPTPTDTPVPPTATNTPVATDTPTPTATRVPSGDEDDDGCQVTAPASSRSGWILLLPAAALLWLRRRSR